MCFSVYAYIYLLKDVCIFSCVLFCFFYSGTSLKPLWLNNCFRNHVLCHECFKDQHLFSSRFLHLWNIHHLNHANICHKMFLQHNFFLAMLAAISDYWPVKGCWLDWHEFSIDIHVALRMNPYGFGDPLTSAMSLTIWVFNFWIKMSKMARPLLYILLSCVLNYPKYLFKPWEILILLKTGDFPIPKHLQVVLLPAPLLQRQLDRFLFSSESQITTEDETWVYSIV